MQLHAGKFFLHLLWVDRKDLSRLLFGNNLCARCNEACSHASYDATITIFCICLSIFRNLPQQKAELWKIIFGVSKLTKTWDLNGK